MYSKEGEYILDPMVGGGTTLIEAKLLGRNALGMDINLDFVKLSEQAVDFEGYPRPRLKVEVGDARDLSFLKADSIDLVVTHPPYMNIIRYSEGKIPEDLSNIGSMPKFLDEIEKIAAELLRVLKPDRHCAILVGDTRRGKHYVPLAFNTMLRFQKAGFILREDIVKVQHNCDSTKRWEAKAKQGKFYLIMHEHLFIFRKPRTGEDLSRIRYSTYPSCK